MEEGRKRMVLDKLVNKLSSYFSWLYYRQWEIWELKIAVIAIVAILFVLLLGLIAWRRRKTKARFAYLDQRVQESSIIGVNKGKRIIKKIVISVIIIAGLIDLYIFFNSRPKPSNGFYLRSYPTGKLVGPVSLPEDYIQPSFDEKIYIVADPTESELEIRNRLLQNRVTVAMTDVPLTELIDLVVIPYLGNNPPTVRFEIEDKSKLTRVNIDARNVSLYEVLFVCAYQANLQVILKDGTIVLSSKE